MHDSRLARIYRLTLTQKLLCLEAACTLVAARLAITWLPFRMIESYMNLRPLQPELLGEKRVRICDQISWAINRTATHLPVKTVCFPRGVAAQTMLRRRGITATLYYGATTDPEKGLISHVWVKDGDEKIVGCDEAAAYKIVAKYPEVR